MDKDEEIARVLADDSPRLRRRAQQAGGNSHSVPPSFPDTNHSEYEDGQARMLSGQTDRNSSDMQSLDDDSNGMGTNIIEADTAFALSSPPFDPAQIMHQADNTDSNRRRSRGRSSIGGNSIAESVHDDFKERCRQIVEKIKTYTDKEYAPPCIPAV